MGLSKKEELEIEYFLLQEVFPKVIFDETSEQFVIHLDDYIPLNLSLNHIRKLQAMCKEYNIQLETLPPQMKREEANKLFEEYQKLKQTKKPTDEMIKRKSEIKKQLALGYMILAYKLINKKISGIEDNRYKEDIYQLGYEVLLKLIDMYIPSKTFSFDNYVRNYLIHFLEAKILSETKGISKSASQDLYRLNLASTRINVPKNDKDAATKLSEETGIPLTRVKNLLIADDLSQTSSIDELSEDVLSHDIISDLEEKYLDKEIKENLVLLLDLLPPTQKEILLLYYGFIDDTKYSLDEIGDRFNFSMERTRQLKEEALKALRLPIFVKYLSIDEKTDDLDITSYLQTEKMKDIQYKLNYIEETLIASLPEDIINEILEKLEPIEQEIFLLIYGLKDGIKYNNKQISKIYGINEYRVNIIKNKVLKITRRYINTALSKNPGDSYLEKLIQDYLNRNKKKR